MNEKNSIKKKGKVKGKRVKTQALECFYTIYQREGQKSLLHLWAKMRGGWFPLGTLYSEIGWRFGTVFPRGKRALPMLQLQYKPLGESVYLRAETRPRKGSRTLRSKAKVSKMVGE